MTDKEWLATLALLYFAGFCFTGVVLTIIVAGDDRVNLENIVAAAVFWPWTWYALLTGRD